MASAVCLLFWVWSLAELIRYPFYLARLFGTRLPSIVLSVITWLRYNAFIVLYPVGFVAEVWCVFLAFPYIKVCD